MGTMIVVGEFGHEANTFVESPTTRRDFQDYREYFNEAVTENLQGTKTAIGGIIEEAREHDIHLIQSVSAFATPGGVVEENTYEFYSEKILDVVQKHQDELDGIMLSLHGAMVAEHVLDGEGELLCRIREMIGDEIPIVSTLDLHANVTEKMVSTVDALIAYETYPHIDRFRTGERGMELLVEAINNNSVPVTEFEQPPMIILQPKAYTQEGPIVEIMERAREVEEQEGVLKASILPGFYHADVPEMGVSTPVVTDGDPALAQEVAKKLAKLLWSNRDRFIEDYPEPEEAIKRAKAKAKEHGPDDGPIVMADFGSNPGGGGAANGTTVLREMLDQEVENAGWAIMHDPEAVEACVDGGVRQQIQTTVGGKTDEEHGDPIKDLNGYVKMITDGRYVNTGTSHMGKGVKNDIGTTTLLECGKNDEVKLVLAERRASAFDAEIWRHVGIQPERLDLICIPSLIAFLGDYGPMSSEVILIDTPGLSAVNPERFEYLNIPRPIYPLDEMNDSEYSTQSTSD